MVAVLNPSAGTIDQHLVCGEETVCASDRHIVVTVASINAPRQRNSTYVQKVRRSIFDTRQPEQPHLPILQYERRPQGPAPCPCYMESCPDTALLYATAMSTSTSTNLCIAAIVTITAITALICQDPARRRISYPTIALSSASVVLLVPVFNFILLTVFGLI